jgi:hypothetical protein
VVCFLLECVFFFIKVRLDEYGKRYMVVKTFGIRTVMSRFANSQQYRATKTTHEEKCNVTELTRYNYNTIFS